MTSLAARLLYAAAALLCRLPWPSLYRLADALATAEARRDRRTSRVTRCNLALAFPELPATQREAMRHSVLRATARQAVETLWMWTHPHHRSLAMIQRTHGTGLLDEAIAAGRGVIIAAPHYGNWELLNRWLAARTPLAILYAPPESAVGEAFLNRVRAADPGADAGRVTQVRAEAAGVRQLFKRLAAGGVIGILPDQQPKLGDGEFAPFFGTPALTMTLLGRLAARSGAVVLMAYCERVPGTDAAGAPAFSLHIERAADEVASAEPATSVAALNAAVERIARRDPLQYQWTYKRFSRPPSGRGEDNPYWPECYR